MITRWSDVKVIELILACCWSFCFFFALMLIVAYTAYICVAIILQVLNFLADLKNLNLQGNPIAERDKLAKKVFLFFMFSFLIFV